MPKNQEITRIRIKTYLDLGYSHRMIQQKEKEAGRSCNLATIARVANYGNADGVVERQERSDKGQSRSLTPRTKTAIKRKMKDKIGVGLSTVSAQLKKPRTTIQRYVQQQPWGTYARAEVTPRLSKKNISDRLSFCKDIVKLAKKAGGWNKGAKLKIPVEVKAGIGFKWPGNSPDLNPIENWWAEIKRRMGLKDPHTKAEVGKLLAPTHRALIKEGLHVTLCESFEKRIKKCIELKGGYTGY